MSTDTDEKKHPLEARMGDDHAVGFKQPFSNLSAPKPTRLSQGHYSETYVATLKNRGNNIKVVCKVPKPGSNTAGSDEWYELQTLASIDQHPHVVKLLGMCFDWGIGPSSTAFILEYHPGGSLEAYIRREGSDLPHTRLCEFAFVMASAVAHVHRNGMVHRDIALRNFVLSKDGLPVIVDFGLSRKDPEYVSRGKQAIPWRRMPLESLVERTFNEKTDVYSLGIIFWELFHCAKMPFHRQRTSAELRDVLREVSNSAGSATVPLEFSDRTPAAVRSLILKMCHVSDPTQRPTAAEVCKQLSNMTSPSFRQTVDELSRYEAQSTDCLPKTNHTNNVAVEDRSLVIRARDSALELKDKEENEPSLSFRGQELFDALEGGEFRKPRDVVEALRSNDVDLAMLKTMNEDDLREVFPNAFGTRKKLLQVATNLRPVYANIVANWQSHEARRGFRFRFLSRISLRRQLIPTNLDVDKVLGEAVYDGNTEVVSQILRAKRLKIPDTMILKGMPGHTPLHIAAYDGRVDMIDCLLQYSGRELIKSVVAFGDCDITALHIASASGHAKVVERLLLDKHLGGSTTSSRAIRMAAKIAAHFGHLETLRVINKILEAEGLSLCHKGLFCKHYDEEKYAIVLKDFLQPDVPRPCYGCGLSFHTFPLHIAAEQEHLHIVKYLMTLRGADVNVRSRSELTPLMLAVIGGSLEVVEYLAATDGVDVNAADKLGRSVLHRAIDNKGRFRSTDPFASDKQLAIFKHLARLDDINVNSKNHVGMTPLGWAIIFKCSSIVQYLISLEKIDINASVCCTYFWNTPLHLATFIGSMDIIKCLTSSKALNANRRNTYGETALHLAVLSGNFDAVSFLTTIAEVDVNARSNSGESALHYTVRRYFLEPDQVCHLQYIGRMSGSDDAIPPTRAHFGKVARHLMSLEQTEMYLADDYGKNPFEIAQEEKLYDFIDVFIARGLNILRPSPQSPANIMHAQDPISPSVIMHMQEPTSPSVHLEVIDSDDEPMISASPDEYDSAS